MRTSTGDLTPHEMRTVAGEALALLRQLEQEEIDETGRRDRWIAALEALAAATPHEMPQDTDTLAEATRYLDLLGMSSLSPSIAYDDAVEDDTAGWAYLPEADRPEEGLAPLPREVAEDEPRFGDEAGVDSPPIDFQSATWFTQSGTTSSGEAPQRQDFGAEQRRHREDEDDIERLEQAVARLEALRGRDSGSAAGQGGEADSQMAGLLELKRSIQQADVEVRAAQEAVAARELNVLQSGYSSDAMSTATRQIEVEERQIQLERYRLDMSERENDRRYSLERQRLDTNEREQDHRHALERQRLEVQHEQQLRELALRERDTEIEAARQDRELAAHQQASARQQATLQLTVGASAITVTSWLVFPGAGVGISLLTLSPFLVALGVLFLLTAVSLSRMRATRQTEAAGSTLSWTDGVRAVPLLPVAALLVATSAVFAFISVLSPGEQRKQLNGYAHRTLHAAERILLGR